MYAHEKFSFFGPAADRTLSALFYPNMVNRLREERLPEEKQCYRKMSGIHVQEANKIIYIIHHTQSKKKPAESLFALFRWRVAFVYTITNVIRVHLAFA